jgi:hypothetical protein
MGESKFGFGGKLLLPLTGKNRLRTAKVKEGQQLSLILIPEIPWSGA